MKTKILITFLTPTTSLTVLAQGYVVFASTKNQGVWYAPGFLFTNTVAVPGDNHITVSFMWANSGIPLVGAIGTSTNSNAEPSWAEILGDPVFHFAQNGGSLVKVAVNNSGLAQGGWTYGASFPLTGSTAGSSIQVLAVAWDSRYETPQLAAAGNSFLGYSSTFTYQTALDSGSAAPTFAASGMPAFGVGVPEPAALSLLVASLIGLFLTKRQLPRKV